MSGIRVAGHERTITPLSPPPGPRQPPALGWKVSCSCGWGVDHTTRRAEAEAAYSRHIQAAAPRCSQCGITVPKSRISKLKSSLCKHCSYKNVRKWKEENPKLWERHSRRFHLKRKYGITIEQYDKMLAEQGYKCDLCGDAELNDSRGFRPHVDHCHKTGIVRGILCGPCNKGLGQFQDDAALLRKAIDYLERKKP